MRVTTKGQVTIPQDVRERLGIEAGSEVEFVTGDDGTVRLVRSGGDGAAIVAGMRERARGHFSMTTEELMALTRPRD